MKLYRLKLFIILLSSLPSLAFADFFKKKDFHLALGAEAINQFHKRGIITYGGYQVFPIFALDVFNPNLQVIGSSLHYRHFFSKNFYFRGRFSSNSTKDKPLYFTSENEGERVRREKTNEAEIYLEFISNDKKYLRFQITQDTTAHKGQYYELFGHYPIGPNKNYQLGFFTALGAGSIHHNEYFYGNGADQFGINNLEYGLMLTIPKSIDMFFPVIKLSHFSILGEGNKTASNVKETSGWSLEALFAFRVF